LKWKCEKEEEEEEEEVNLPKLSLLIFPPTHRPHHSLTLLSTLSFIHPTFSTANTATMTTCISQCLPKKAICTVGHHTAVPSHHQLLKTVEATAAAAATSTTIVNASPGVNCVVVVAMAIFVFIFIIIMVAAGLVAGVVVEIKV
jgi:hypothetical protein